jgi:polyhydroxyalkanoate synthesis regulator phasin
MSTVDVKLAELIGCNNTNVVAFAKQAAELKTLVESGAISKNEYEELVNDLKRTQVIASAADDLAIKSAIHEVLVGIESAATALL